MVRKVSDKTKDMEMKTSSRIPKTPEEKKMWERSRQLVGKETGRYSEGETPWKLVTHIYELEKKAGKVIKPKEIRKEKKEPAASRYKTERSAARKDATKDAMRDMEKRKKSGRIVVKSSGGK